MHCISSIIYPLPCPPGRMHAVETKLMSTECCLRGLHLFEFSKSVFFSWKQFSVLEKLQTSQMCRRRQSIKTKKLMSVFRKVTFNKLGLELLGFLTLSSISKFPSINKLQSFPI